MGASIAFGNPQMRYTQVGGDIQNQLRYMQQRTRQQEQDVQAMDEKLLPHLQQKTIRDVIGNMDKQGGVQRGQETQEAVGQEFANLQAKYQPQINQALQMKEDAVANGLNEYDAQGNPIDSQEVRDLNRSLNGMTKQYDEELGALSQKAANSDYSILDRVSDPEDAEQRLTNALMNSGVNADVARTQAKAEMAPYYQKDLTKREEARIAGIDSQIEQELKLGKSSTSTYGGGSRGTKGYKSTKNSAGILAHLDKVGNFTKAEEGRGFFEWYDHLTADNRSDVSAKLNTIQNLAPGATAYQIKAAAEGALEGSAENPQLNESIWKANLANILEKQGSGSGSGGQGGGSFTGYKNESAVRRNINKLQSQRDSLVSGGSNKSAAQNAQEFLGVDPKASVSEVVKEKSKTGSKPTTKQKKTIKDIISTPDAPKSEVKIVEQFLNETKPTTKQEKGMFTDIVNFLQQKTVTTSDNTPIKKVDPTTPYKDDTPTLRDYLGIKKPQTSREIEQELFESLAQEDAELQVDRATGYKDDEYKLDMPTTKSPEQKTLDAKRRDKYVQPSSLFGEAEDAKYVPFKTDKKSLSKALAPKELAKNTAITNNITKGRIDEVNARIDLAVQGYTQAEAKAIIKAAKERLAK